MTKYCTGFLMASLAISAALQYGENYSHAATVRTVALSGQPAPGTPSGIVYENFNSTSFYSPVLNDAGHVAYFAALRESDTDLPLGDGVWSEGSGNLALVARTGTHAPGTPANIPFSNFVNSRLLLSSTGQVTFSANLTGSEIDVRNEHGIWSETSGSLALVARDRNAAPGTPGGTFFSGLSRESLVANEMGQIAFVSYLGGTGVNNDNNSGVWSSGSGSLSLVARAETQAPGTPDGVRYSAFGGTLINDAGRVAFGAGITGPGVSHLMNEATDIGIWSQGTGSLTLVARAGSQAPGTPSGVSFSEFRRIGFNNAGHVVFDATLRGTGVEIANESGIWSEASGALTLVARAGDQAPGAPVGVNYTSFAGVMLNDSGTTVFNATLGGMNSNDGIAGVWSEHQGVLEAVALNGQHAPGTAVGVSFGSEGTGPQFGAALNEAGQIAFAARLLGNGVDSTNNAGIWASDRTGALHLLVRSGDLLEVGPGDLRTVDELRFVAGSGSSDGRPTGFNDVGQLAFRAAFSDGSEGIFISDLVAIPEPKSLALLVVGLLLPACWMFRRRLAVRCVVLTSLVVGALTAPGLAQHNVLHSFNGDVGDGYNPLGSLLQSDATLYGMTNNGGAADYGTIFRIGTDGTGYKRLHSFNTVDGDGYVPYYGSLIRSGSSLYGMTLNGGTYTGGTIFRIGTDGTDYSLLHSFAPRDGQAPFGSLLHSGTTLYGMAAVGGANDVGTIFQIGIDGTDYRVLHSFSGADGAYPHGSLIQSGSTLYGMTTDNQEGTQPGRGKIFRIGTDGADYSVIHTFTGVDGSFPYGSLLQSGSTLYGMTHTGSYPDTGGTVFRIETDGTAFRVLHSFAVDDGLNPYGSLIQSGSTLYGMATNASGGSEGAGTIFQIGTDGTGFEVIHSFSGFDGGYPHGSLIQSGSTLYGMTTVGGKFADGVVFSLVVPEPASFALSALGLPILIWWNWRRSRARL